MFNGPSIGDGERILEITSMADHVACWDVFATFLCYAGVFLGICVFLKKSKDRVLPTHNEMMKKHAYAISGQGRISFRFALISLCFLLISIALYDRYVTTGK